MAGISARLRALLGVAAILAALVAVPGASAASSGRLVVTGPGDASVDLVIRRPSEVFPDDLRIATKGTHAGIAIMNAKGRVVAFSLNVTRWVEARPSAADQPLSLGSKFERTVLQPGRYKVLLITDGPTTVSIPVSGDLVRTVRPAVPRPVDVRIEETTRFGLPVGDGVERMDLRRASFFAVAVHTETYAMQARAVNFCLASVGVAACHPFNDIGGTAVKTNAGPGGVGDGWVRTQILSPGGAPDDRGIYDAIFRDVSADLPARRDSLVVII